MMRTIAAVFAAFWLASALAHAQMSPEFQSAFGEAEQMAIAGETADAFAAGERAFAIAETPEEMVRSLFLMAEMSFALENYGESENLAGSAMELMREHFDESVELMQRLLVLQGNAALRIGNNNRWRTYMDEAERLNEAESHLHWIVSEEGLQHRLSGYECPQTTAMGVLYEPLSFDLSGLDVGCKYVFRERPDIVVTMHVYRDEGSTLDETYDAARASLDLVFQNGTIIEENRIDLAGVPVSFAIVRLPDRETGVWTTQIGDWSVKLRMTQFGNATRADFDSAAEQTFANAGPIAEHVRRCQELSGADRLMPAGDLMVAGMEGAVFLTPQTFDARAPNQRLACLIDDAPLNDDSLAYAELNAGGAPVAFTARNSDGSGYSVHAVSVNLLLLPDVESEADTRFLAFAQDNNGFHIFGMFETAPSPEGFSDFARQVANGTIAVVSRVSIDENGNSNIVLSSPTTEDD